MTYGDYIVAVCVQLTKVHGWVEHANALLYTQGAPKLLNAILAGCLSKQTVEETAAIVHHLHMEGGV